ncbi:MAG TPA: DUF899 domain-containing protein [Trebonia sp.]|nr:DUF899 domain-containing protein [Trebonia sp.]
MKTPPIVTPQEWEAARQELLVTEKEVTRARDALAAKRRRMPWLAVEKDYEFDGPDGRVTLLGLFQGRRQLIVYRAFFEPGVHGWPDHACVGCSLVADQVAHVAHLNARDTTLVFASRAPQADIARVQARMGWAIPWYTLTDEFDKDFGVDEWHGTNAFIRDGDSVFRTYFINNRGDESMGSTWSYLDITALGRQEEWEDSPEGHPQTPPYQWWRWHDAYGDLRTRSAGQGCVSWRRSSVSSRSMALRKASCSLGASLSRTRASGVAAPSSHSPIRVAWAAGIWTMVRRRSAGSGWRSTNPARSRSASTPLTVGTVRPSRAASSPTVTGPPRSCSSAATCRGPSGADDSGVTRSCQRRIPLVTRGNSCIRRRHRAECAEPPGRSFMVLPPACRLP